MARLVSAPLLCGTPYRIASFFTLHLCSPVFRPCIGILLLSSPAQAPSSVLPCFFYVHCRFSPLPVLARPAAKPHLNRSILSLPRRTFATTPRRPQVPFMRIRVRSERLLHKVPWLASDPLFSPLSSDPSARVPSKYDKLFACSFFVAHWPQHTTHLQRPAGAAVHRHEIRTRCWGSRRERAPLKSRRHITRYAVLCGRFAETCCF